MEKDFNSNNYFGSSGKMQENNYLDVNTSEDKNSPWKRVLIRDEFLKFYFVDLGMNDSLSIERHTNIHDLQKKKTKNKKGLFVIVERQYKDQDQLGQIELKSFNSSDVKIIYPNDDSLYDDSLKFLALAFSGFSVINDKDTKNLFVSDILDKENTDKTFINFLENLDPNADDDQRFFELIKNKKLREKHNKIADEIFEDKLIDLPTLKRHYSLFFMRNNKLWEYRTDTAEMLIGNKIINEANFKEELHSHIVSNNENTAQKSIYSNNFTIFSESHALQEESFSALSNVWEIILILIITLLFLMNYFIAFPQELPYQFNQSISNYFEYDAQGNNKIAQVSNLDDIKTFIYSDILDNIYNYTHNNYYQTISSKQTTTNSNSEYIDESLNIGSFNYYHQKQNYFSGLLINFQRAQKENFTDSTGVNYTTRASKLGYYNSIPQKDNSVFLSFGSNDGSVSNTLFKLFFKSSFSKNSLYFYKQQLGPVFDDSLYAITVNIFEYNADYDIVSIHQINFDIHSYGNVDIQTYFYNFYVNMSPKKFNILLVVNILYIIFLLPFAFLVFKVFSLNIIELVKTRNYNFNWYDWVDIISLAMSITSMILFYNLVLFNPNQYPIAISYTADIEHWIDYALKVRTFHRITGFTMIFLMIRLVRFLFSAYPLMGIVFLTLKQANKEILAFWIILITILSGIFALAHNIFGWYMNDFLTLSRSSMSIILMFLGFVDYGDFINQQAYSAFAPYFFIVFMMFSNLYLFNMFLCIIRNNYIDVKEKNEMINLSNSLIKADDRNIFYDKFRDLVLFRNPLEIEEEEENYNKKKENVDKLGRKKISMNFWKILKYNFSRLNLLQYISGNVRSREETTKKTFEKFQVIRKMKTIEYIEDVKMDYDLKFNSLLDSLCFVLFIIIFVIMLNVQLKIGNSNLIQVYIQAIYSSINTGVNFHTFQDVETTMTNIFTYFYPNHNSNEELCDPNANITLNPYIIPNYIFLNPPYFRITFRLYQFESSNIASKNQYFPLYLVDPTPLTDSYCNSISELKSSIYIKGNDVLEFPYTIPGAITGDTCGGFIYLVNSTSPYCEANPSLNYKAISSYLFNNNVGSVVFDTALFSLQHEFIIYIKNSFINNSLAGLQHTSDILNIPINRYKTQSDFTRMVIEIMYLMFVFYFLLRVVNDIYKLVFDIISRDNENFKRGYDDKEEYERFGPFNKFFRFSFKKYQNAEGITVIFRLIFDLLLMIIKKLFKFVFILCRCVVKYIEEDYFNILNIASIIISISMSVKWYKILIVTMSLSFDFTLEVNDSRTPNLFLIERLENYYESYIYSQSINGLLIFIRMIQFLKFSRLINSLISVLKKASLSIYYHLIFIALINLGFALCTYSIYGQSSGYFNTLGKSILSMTIFLASRGTLATYDTIDPDLLPVIVLIYNIINILILCNILSAIIIESYRAIKNKQTQANEVEKYNFLKNIYVVIKEKMKMFWKICESFVYILKREVEESNENPKQVNFLRKQFEKDVNYLNAERVTEKARSSLSFFSEKNFLIRGFLDKLTKRIEEIESLSDNSNNPNRNLNNGKIMKLEEYKTKDTDKELDSCRNIPQNEANKDTTKTNLKKGKVTIMVKMMTYAYILSGYDFVSEEEDELKKDEEKMEKYDTRANDKFSGVKREEENNKKNLLLLRSATEEERAMTGFIKKYEENLKNKGLGFFKPNIFHKYSKYKNDIKILPNNEINPYRLSKESRQESSLVDYLTIQLINQVDSDSVYNLGFKFCVHNTDECLDCDKYENNFKNISCSVYDILVKNFYHPTKLSRDEKDLYFGYYFNIIDQRNENLKIDRNIIKTIEKAKQKNFICEILFLRYRNIEEENDVITITKRIKEEYRKQSSKIKLMHSRGSDFSNCHESLELYKNYVIWNTIYIVLFQKCKTFTRNLKNSSKSYDIYQKYKNNRSKFYTNFLIELFAINNQNNEDGVAILKQTSMNKLNDFPELLSLNFIEDAFYSDQDKYLIEENLFELYSKHLPKEKIKQENFKEYPEVFSELWSTYVIEEKFNLFFGYNKRLKFDQEFTLSEEFFPEEFSKISKVWEFFSASNRAQIFTLLKTSDRFKLVLQQEVNHLFNTGIIPENKNLSDSVEALKYFQSINLNSLLIYKFFRCVFDKTLKKAKKIVLRVESRYKNDFKKNIENNMNLLNSAQNQLSLAKFYQTADNLCRFKKLKKYYDKEKSSQPTDSNHLSNLENVMMIIKNKETIEEVNQNKIMGQENKNEIDASLNNSFEENELFIFALSMNSIQLINTIQKIEDPHLKEFYLHLFNYIYSDDETYINHRNYLKRKVKLNLIEKYEIYLNYILNKENVNQKLDKYENERSMLIKSEKQLEEDLERYATTEKIKKELLVKLTNKYNEEAVDDEIIN